MRTIVHCREAGLALVLGCSRCGRREPVDLLRFCRAFDRWTVEELERAGALPCPGCGGPAGASVEGAAWGHAHQVECWAGAYGHYQPPATPGLSG